jgi:AraC family L-rhamnose operon transcriptional activator RhaR/AraC family L-rhamnose operon regulatory protein RhaS
MTQRIPEHRKAFWKFDEVNKCQGNQYVKYYNHPLKKVLPLHSHDFYEINIIISGSGTHYIRDRELLVGKGDVFVIPKNVKHGYCPSVNMSVYHILLSDRFSVEFGQLLDRLPGYRFLFHIEPLLRSSLEKPFYLKSDCISLESISSHIGLLENNIGGAETECVCHVLSLIAEMAGKMHRLHALNDKELPDDKLLSLVESIAYIDAHCPEKLDYGSLAEKCAVSYSTYWRLFKKLTGTTPMEYQIAARIKLAERLLRSSDDTVLSVALSCGFYDSSHFIREFVKRKNITPTEYRTAPV